MDKFYLLPGITIFLLFFLIFLTLKDFKKIVFFCWYLTLLNGLFLLLSHLYPLDKGGEFKISYILSREGIMYCLFLLLFFKSVFLNRFKIFKYELPLYMFLTVGIIMLFIHGHPKFSVRIGGFKEIYNFVILYFIGRYNGIIYEEDLVKVEKNVLKIGIILSLFVIFEVLFSCFSGKYFLSEIGLSKYFYLMFSASKTIYSSTTALVKDWENFIPGNFRGELGLRYSGISLDPASFAFFMVLPLILSLIFKKTILTFLFLLTIFLSFGKAGIMLVVMVIIYYLWRRHRSLFIVYLLIGFILTMCGYEWFHRIIISGSTPAHISFFIQGIRLLFDNPFGYGLGYGGGIGYMAGEIVDKGVGDTFWGSVISQMGIIGLILFLISILTLIKSIRKKRLMCIYGINKFFPDMLSFSILIGLLISSLSGATFLWNAMGLFMVFAGIIVNIKIEEKGFNIQK